MKKPLVTAQNFHSGAKFLLPEKSDLCMECSGSLVYLHWVIFAQIHMAKKSQDFVPDLQSLTDNSLVFITVCASK